MWNEFAFWICHLLTHSLLKHHLVWLDSYFVKVEMLFVHCVEISSSIKQIVGGIGTDRVFEHGSIDLWHAAVVELVPLVSGWILTVRSVVTEAHISVMIWNSIKIINQLLTIRPAGDVFG